MLTKMIDGKEVMLSQNEERQQRAFWALNEKYPEYSGHCGWDGASEPFHNILGCIDHHKHLVSKAYQLAKADLDKKIEMAQEEDNQAMHKSLLQQRKALRAHLDLKFDGCKTVDELRSSVPQDLKEHWNK